jgi:hypothetical protein
MPKKKKPNTVKTTETTEDVAAEVFHAALVHVRDEIKAIDGGKKPKKGFTPAETITFLAKNASSFAAEHRKAKTAAKKERDALTWPDVFAWFRELDAHERSTYVRELQQIDSKRSVLG